MTKRRKRNLCRWVSIVLLVTIFTAFVATLIPSAQAAGRGWFDTYRYDEAVVSLLDGTVIRGELEKWWEYENSDMLQVQISGAVYLTHSTNIVLIKNP